MNRLTLVATWVTSLVAAARASAVTADGLEPSGSAVPVPEPSTLLLLAVGLLVLAAAHHWAGKRRR